MNKYYGLGLFVPLLSLRQTPKIVSLERKYREEIVCEKLIDARKTRRFTDTGGA